MNQNLYQGQRINLLFCILLVPFCAIIANLYTLQVLNTSYYRSMGEQQYGSTITTKPPRALIYDRNNNPLVINVNQTSAFIIPNKLKEPEKIKAFLAQYYPPAYERLGRYSKNHFMYIKRHLSDQEIERIKQHELTTDIHFLKEPSRFYPHQAFAAIIGMTDIDNNGLLGLEGIYNHQLGGKPSQYRLEQDARSGHYYFDKQTTIEGSDGAPMTLTLDSTLQFLAFDELQDTLEKTHARDGAVLIMDPVSGDIMAMVQSPLFDPNNREAVDLEITKNKMVTEAYELGSVMKIFLALAALEEGVITPEEIIDCENRKYAYINGMRIGTLHEHGTITFSEVIELSNNIGTSKVAMRLGEKLYNHLIRCGFGQKTGLDFPGEQRGFVNPPSNWSGRSVFSLSFGYEMRLSLLQLARAFSLIANNGILVTPHLIKTQTIKPQPTERLYSQKTLDQLREMLRKAVTQGTARRARIDGYETLGKTGTACVLVDGKYSMDRNIFTFAGLVERGNYKRVIITFVREVPKHDATASTVTVPLFERIAKKMLIHDKII